MKPLQPIFLAISVLAFVIGLLSPLHQDPGAQATVFEGDTITTTTQSEVIACGQGNGSIGRKTLVVHNQTGGGVVTVTAELRDTTDRDNFTSGYLAVGALAAGSLSSDTSTPDEAAGRFCQVSATSASTSVITVTLRKE